MAKGGNPYSEFLPETVDGQIALALNFASIVLFILAVFIPPIGTALILAAVLLSAVAYAVMARRKVEWRWQPPEIVGWVLAVISIGVGLVAAFVFSRIVSVDGSFRVVLYFMIATFSVLGALGSINVVWMKAVDFEADCRRPNQFLDTAAPDTAGKSASSFWMTLIKAVFNVVFLGVWLAAMAYFYFAWKADQGDAVISVVQLKLLETVFHYGIPICVIVGLALNHKTLLSSFRDQGWPKD